LSENVHCMSASSIHILYNHTPSGGVGSLPGRRTPFTYFNWTEVVKLTRLTLSRAAHLVVAEENTERSPVVSLSLARHVAQHVKGRRAPPRCLGRGAGGPAPAARRGGSSTAARAAWRLERRLRPPPAESTHDGSARRRPQSCTACHTRCLAKGTRRPKRSAPPRTAHGRRWRLHRSSAVPPGGWS
jgi:hypothetical protein